MLLTREEFKKYYIGICSNEGIIDPLFSQEEYYKINCKWFVLVPCLNLFQQGLKKEYWDWCDKHLTGKLLCFSSDILNDQEWWGFEKEEDIVLWSLKFTSK